MGLCISAIDQVELAYYCLIMSHLGKKKFDLALFLTGLEDGDSSRSADSLFPWMESFKGKSLPRDLEIAYSSLILFSFLKTLPDKEVTP